jgi:hypothetical protein
MGHQGNWLARLLAYTTRLEALEKEDRHHTTYGSSPQCHQTAHVHWLHQLLLWHVAESCTYPKTIDQSIRFEKESFKWTDDMQKAFDKMRLLMAANALAAYQNHNKWFDVYTDASDFQLGTCIIQEGRLVAYFSWKLTKSQQNYTTMEKEMLSIIATLEEFQSMLLGANIHVFMDHKTWHLILLKHNVYYAGIQKLKSFCPCYTTLRAPAIFLPTAFQGSIA